MSKEKEFAKDLSAAVEGILETVNIDIWQTLHSIGEQCESPIEQKLFMSLVKAGWLWVNRVLVVSPRALFSAAYDEGELRLHACPPEKDRSFLNKLSKAGVVIELQVPIGEYRADFVMTLVCPRNSSGGIHSIVIECDGHDYHDRTKEQAARDKSRDRSMKMMGHEVFRFTGSEIWADPEKCASQVMEFLENASYGITAETTAGTV